MQTGWGGGRVHISRHMTDLQMDHLGLAEIGCNWPSLQEDDRIPQRFRGQFMSHKIDSTVAKNKNYLLSGYYQFRVTASLVTGNL